MLHETLSLWYSICMSNLKTRDLYEPRPKIGTICFFIGSIDSFCQHMNIEVSKFTKTLLDFFKEKKFFKFNEMPSEVVYTNCPCEVSFISTSEKLCHVSKIAYLIVDRSSG